MPNIRLKVFDTQSSEWVIDEDVDATDMRDIQARVSSGPNQRFTDRATRENAFADPERLVTGDITLFRSSAKSKAGN